MQHDTMYLQNSSDLVPFEESRYRYSFEERCQESSLFYLEDGRYTVFLSTKGTNEEVGWEALIKFLKFVGAGLEKSTAGKIDGTVYRGYFLGFSCIKSSSILSCQFWHFFKEKGRGILFIKTIISKAANICEVHIIIKQDNNIKIKP